jgi:signal peptidase
MDIAQTLLRRLQRPRARAALTLGRRAATVLAGVVFAVTLGAVAAAALPTLFGYHAYIVYGGSMEPELPLGSVAVARPVTPEEVQRGDIVAFEGSHMSSPVLHRVIDIRIQNGERLLITRGDANAVADAHPVHPAQIGDVVVYHVPLVGFLIHFGRTTGGLLLFFGAPVAALLAHILWRIARWRSHAAQAAPKG